MPPTSCVNSSSYAEIRAGDIKVAGKRLVALVMRHVALVVAAVTHTADNADDENFPASRWLLDRPRHIHLLID